MRLFGKNGRVMHVRANGGDDAPVEADDAVKSVSNEMTFARDLETREDVEAALATIAAKVGRRLRRKGLAGRTLSLRVRFSDRSVRSVQRQLARPSDDELAFTPLLFRMVEEAVSYTHLDVYKRQRTSFARCHAFAATILQITPTPAPIMTPMPRLETMPWPLATSQRPAEEPPTTMPKFASSAPANHTATAPVPTRKPTASSMGEL